MSIVLEALTRLGYDKAASDIAVRWRELIASRGFKKDADYQLCFPNEILKRFAEEALAGYRAMNCRCSSANSGNRVHDLLNEAWSRFWKAPNQYAEWEKQNGVILPKR